MPANYERIKNRRFDDVVSEYSIRDTFFYALSLNIATDPMDVEQLRYVYEDKPQALPSMATILGYPPNWMRESALGFDWPKMVHGSQSIEMLAALPIHGIVTGKNRVVELFDMGAGKGALLVLERVLLMDNVPICRMESTVFARGDGGCGGPPRIKTEPDPLPQRDPDAVRVIRTLPQAALMYRLNADMNPLHADPAIARAAGFQKPILHGLCTYGMACHAIVEAMCNNDAAQLKTMYARFSAFVLPGETLRMEIWNEPARIRFRCVTQERQQVALSDGVATTKI
jgi:acyl dehydratase